MKGDAMSDGSSTTSSEDDRDDEQALHKVYHVAFLLRQKLPLDVVSTILHHADFFVTQCGKLYRNQVAFTMARDGEACHIITSPPINGTVRTQTPVRMVTFDLWYHCIDAWREYLRCSRQFAVAILRQGEEGQCETLCQRRIVRDEACIQPKISANNQERIEWGVQWRIDGPQADESAWVGSLKIGDRINVMALPPQEDSSVYVRGAQVTVHTLAVV